MAGRLRPTAPRGLPPWVVDALLGVGVTVIVSLVISAEQGGRQQPGAIAYLWAAGLGSLMLVRRQFPRIVLAVTAFGLFAYYAAGYPAVGVAVPVAAALFSAAATAHLTAAVVTAIAVLGVSLFFRLLEGQTVSFVVGYDLPGHVTLMAAAIALGDNLRSRRAQQAQQRQIGELTARQHRQDAERRVHAERLAIARDLHDSIGHTTSVISLHTDVARESLGRDQTATAAALDLIKETTTRTMRELRRTVAVLRTPRDPSGAVVSLANLATLTAAAEAAGTRVDVDVRTAGPLPPTVEAAAFRIVQEAVTNIVRHSGATHAAVTAHVEDTLLHLRIADDGSTGLQARHPGHGIAGMTERANALGGTLTAGRESSGFVVHATIPLEQPS